MFERYTEKARRVIFFARYEASQFGSPYIETEHLLLGILREAKAVVYRSLGPDFSQEGIREKIAAHTTIREKINTSVDLPLSNECKRVLAYAAEESMRGGDRDIGPEHLLLGLLREKDCFAASLLTDRGVELVRLRQALSEGAREGSSLREPPLPARLFEGFSQKLTSAIIFAIYEASRFGSSAVETEHLLLGLIHEDKAAVDRLLGSDLSEDSIRLEIQANGPVQSRGTMNLAHMPLTDQGKRALVFAEEEARRLGHEAVGPEHVVFGLLREEGCFAARMLLERGADFEEIRKKLAIDPPSA